MKKNPAEIAGTRYKDEKLMSRVQKTDGTSRCFAQMKTLNDSPYIDIHVPTLANMYGRRLKCYAPIGYAQQVDDALTSNPQDIVFGPSDFLQDLVSDIENAKSSVVLSCNTLQYMKAPLAKALQSLGSRGIDCFIIIRKASARDNDFIQTGIKVSQHSSRSIRAAIIDRSLFWFGSIDLASNFHHEDDSVMRAFMPEVASEMLGYLIDDE